jgi:hypothetical protein
MSGGAEYQSRVVAWMAVRILTGGPLRCGLPDTIRPVRIHVETTDPTDDSRVETSSGGQVWLQAKRRIAVASRDFGKTIDQMVRQWLHGRGAHIGHEPLRLETDRLVLVTSRDSPASTVRQLPAVLERLRGATALGEVARSTPEREVLTRLLGETRSAWQRATGHSPGDDEVRAVLRFVQVQILEVEAHQPDEEHAREALRGRLVDPAAAGTAWNNLVVEGLRLSKLGAGAGLEELAVAVGHPLRPAGPDLAERARPRLEAPSRAATYVPWTRFWGPPDVEPALDDAYLLDPIRHSPFANAEAITLEQLSGLPCVILLGPMGMGKTVEMEAEVARLDKAWRATRQHDVLFLDLIEFQTADSLATSWFDSEIWQRWWPGAHHLTVVLDSVDEMSFSLSPLLRILRERLLNVDRARLHLRVGCRSGAWPRAFEDTLREIFPDGVQLRALWPLRRDDVAVLATQRYGMDEAASAAFLQAVRRALVEALATRPTTLRFLLESYRAGGGLPALASDLYRDGCLRLCQDEQLQTGQRAPRGLTARERLAVAQVLAGLSVLTGRRLLLRHDPAAPVDGALSPRDVVGLRAELDGRAIVIDERNYEEILTAGLLAPAGEQRVRWAHASYADFLAALTLYQRPLATLRSLMVAADEAGEFIVPGLTEFAVWLMELRPELLGEILRFDVLAALQGAARALDEMKAAIVDRWLDGIRTGSVHVPLGIHSHLGKLRYPGLAAQLTPYIRDRTRGRHQRRFASDIAEACGLVELQDLWLQLALDTTEIHDVRVAAADAIVHLGDAAAKRALVPLAEGAAGPDPNDDLRGLGLRAAYPDTWNLATVLAHLPPPQEEDYLGYYEYFVADLLPSKIDIDDLPALLQAAPAWLRRRVAFPDLIAKTMALAWRHLHRHDVALPLAQILVARVQHDLEAFGDDY